LTGAELDELLDTYELDMDATERARREQRWSLLVAGAWWGWGLDQYLDVETTTMPFLLMRPKAAA
jgi:hypothetical protein